NQKFTNYFKKDGLPDNSISGLLLDDSENLWISTNNGVSRFSPSTKTFRNFTMSDGLQSSEFKKGTCKSRTGQMYFAGTGGLNEFTPAKIKPDGLEYPLLFTGFEIFNKPVPISSDENLEIRIPQTISASKELQISYRHNVFTIHFASLNYTNPENKKYSYRLEGFEREWNSLSNLHAATYTNLDPGSYTFKVRSLNNTGDLSANVAELKINISPPVWKTWWFKILLSIFMTSALISVFILRTRNLAKINRELTAAVDEKTKEINQKNKILFQQREELAAQNEELIQSHEEISAQRDMVAKQNATLESEVEKRTRELVEYNHQLEQFAFIAAHNLRAPVARILGLGSLLNIPNQNENDREQIYPRIVSATRELDTVVKDLNTILYLKKNSDSVISLIDLETETALVISNLDHEISATQAVINTDFSAVSTIYSVKPYFDSILYNLLGNAIKYRHPDRPPRIHIKTQKIGNEICLSVVDNGLGIDVDLFQDKLFTLYSRFHLHIEGKGMGLYLVKTQLAAMGGRVEIESKVNFGTTFKVFFKEISIS
ncbi:MAG TPA: triple tyrosine motif-containing protein, partial [Chryseolinea sp.]|nr:triple tyrosine motif-containing protein [Chryseolinea sp.]